jgi:hypothetical protein
MERAGVSQDQHGRFRVYRYRTSVIESVMGVSRYRITVTERVRVYRYRTSMIERRELHRYRTIMKEEHKYRTIMKERVRLYR